MRTRQNMWTALLVTWVALCVSTINAKTIYVAHDATGDNDGTEWAHAFTDVQEAIDSAEAGDEVWIKAGTYTPTSWPNLADSTDDRAKHFSLRNHVAVYGGFAGHETSLTERNSEIGETILSGEIGTADSKWDNCYHVFYHPEAAGLDDSASLADVTITGGHATGASPHDNGGGIYNESSSPSFNNCTFTGNYATSEGGGVHNESSSPTINKCTFTGNVATNGGGINNNDFSSSTIINCTLQGNSAGDSGGGIRNFYSSPRITNSTIVGNKAKYGGGGISNSQSQSIITNCTVSGNRRGISNSYSSPTIINCIFWGNGSEIYNSDASSPSVSFCVVKGGYPEGTNILTSDPKLQPLYDYGGLVETMAIISTSSAVDAGAAEAAPETDARGITRPGGDGVDIGAFEFIENWTPWWECNANTIEFRDTVVGYALSINAFQVRGSLLDHDVVIDAPDGFELSQDGKEWAHALTLPSINKAVDQTVFVRFRPSKVGEYDDEVAISCVAETPIYVRVTGAGIEQVIIHVSLDGDDTTGDSWVTAFPDLQRGINQAASMGMGAEVWIKAGKYRPSGWPNRPIPSPRSQYYHRWKHFSLRNGVAVYGGFGGAEASRTDRDPATWKTILSGNVGAIGDRTDDCLTVFYHNNSLDASAHLDGVTITDGSGGAGAGIHNNNSSPTITNCMLSRNSGSSGGGIYNFESSPTISNCVFFNNQALNEGGGIHNTDFSSPQINNCTFLSNAADAGGGIHNEDFSSPQINNCTLSNNTASYGGGIRCDISSPTIANCILWDNSSWYDGSEIYTSYGGFSLNPIVSNCVIEGGYAGGTGIIDADPMLDSEGLKHNGGPIPTIAILTGGSGIDKADPTTAPETDARGILRDDVPDIGAYELSTTPEIAIHLKEQEIPNNSPGAIELGELLVGDTQETTFTIRNIGEADLLLEGGTPVTATGDFSLRERPGTTTLPSLTETTFTIVLLPTTAGLKTGSIFLESNDADDNPFVFQITANAVTAEDSEAPVISNMPADQTVPTNSGEAFATVDWSEPGATDNVDGTLVPTSTHSSGDQFEVGDTVVTYTATDAANNTTTASFTITVEDRESPVIANVPTDITVEVAEGETSAIATWTPPSADDNVGVTLFTPNYNSGDQFSIGTTVVTYTATDAAGNTATASFNVTVREQNNTNQSPIAVASNNDADPNVGDTLTLTGSGSNDPDNGPNSLTYSWLYISGPEAAPGPTMTDVSGDNMTMTFVPALPGDYVFELTIDDGADTDSEQVTVAVSAAAELFTVEITSPLDTQELAANQPFTVKVKAEDSPHGIDRVLIFVRDIVAKTNVYTSPSIDAEPYEFEVPALPVGNYGIMARAFNKDAESKDSSWVLITLKEGSINAPPVFPNPPSASPNTIKANETTTLTAEATDADAGDTVSYTWEMVEGPEDVTFTSPNAPTTDATFSIDGTYKLRVIATDGKIDVPSSVIVTVEPVVADNNAPMFTKDTSADPTTIKANETTTLTAEATDADAGDTVSYTWEMVDGPGDVTFTAPHAATTDATFSVDGTYKLRVIATDGKIDVPSTIVTVVVQPKVVDNIPPTISRIEAAPAIIEIDGTTILTVTAEELDAGDELNYSWVQINGETVVVVSPESASTEVNGFTATGTYEFEVTVSDGTDSVTDRVTVEVIEQSTDGTPSGGGDDGGCGCTINEGTNGTVWVIVFIIAGLLLRIRISSAKNSARGSHQSCE